ncbi:MAG: hypothetical protein JSR90_12665 [Proteobacteria bacterium]|nr:hypothetical protein [Pseudomonadota bacterium]
MKQLLESNTAYWVLIYENRGLAKDFDKEKKERERKSLQAAFWPDNSRQLSS